MRTVTRLFLFGALTCSLTCAAQQRKTDAAAVAPTRFSSLSTPPDATDSHEGRFVSPTAEQYFGDYARVIRSRIEERYVHTMQEEYAGGYGKATVFFLVQPDGTVTDLRIAQDRGDDGFAELCRTVVSSAGPFDAVPYDTARDLPTQFENEPIAFRLQFEFAPDTPPADQWADSATLPQESAAP